MSDATPVTATFCTGTGIAAIGIVHLAGTKEALERVLVQLSQRRDWPVGAVRLIRIQDLDDLLIARPSECSALIMPHGGVHIRRLLTAALQSAGVTIRTEPRCDENLMYPEARERIEAAMLRTLATAASPLAIDLLLAQPARWKAFHDHWTEADVARSTRLNRLLIPPRIVLVGPANAGKSTLTNRLAGRDVSIAADRPGTTRDYIVTRLELAGLIVEWFDTPGQRQTSDRLEHDAQRIAASLIREADLVMAMTDHEQPWPHLERAPDLKIANKADRGSRDDADIAISAEKGTGVQTLVERIVNYVIPRADLESTRPWRFTGFESNDSNVR